jgi:hypothetical protein
MSAQFFLGNQDKLVASHRRFPIQPIALIQHDLVAFRVSRHGTAGGGKKDIDLVNVGVLAHLIRGKHDRWMVSLAKGAGIDIPLLHGRLRLFRVGFGDYAGFRKALVQRNVFLIKAKISRRPEGNRFNFRRRLQNISFMASQDINDFPILSLLHQAAQVRFGCA